MPLSAGVIFIIVLVSFCLLCCGCIVVKQRARKRALLAPKPQERFNRQPLRAGSKSTLQGVKVLELSTVVAAPTAGRLLRELGAEVVKVEDQVGDYWRRFFLEFQQPRDVSVGFDVANMGKASICLNLQTESGKREFKRLLKDADIFFTNVRQNSLKKLRLDYNSIKKEFPNLVYGHISAWGQVGPDCSLPGYDLGAFWAMSGLASKVCKTEGNHSACSYPVASGDCITAFSLAAGIISALSERITTGRGRYVHTSLLASGVYCLSPLYTQFKGSDDKVPIHASHLPYLCSDNKSIQLLGLGFENEQTMELCRIFGIDSTLTNNELKSLLSTKFGEMTRDNAVKMLAETKVLFSVPRRYLEYQENAEAAEYQDLKLHRRPGSEVGIDDVPVVIRLPFEMNTGMAEVRSPGPKLGAHTDDFVANLWTVKRNVLEHKSKSNDEHADVFSRPKPHKGVKIIELSYVGTSVSSSARWFCDMGATITKIVPLEPFDAVEGNVNEQAGGWTDFWAEKYPAFGCHLNHGKTIIKIDLSDPTLEGIIGKTGIFMTNYPRSLLRKYGLDHETLTKKYPNLIYALVTPRGLDFPETPVHDVGPFYTDSFFWEFFSFQMPLTITPPLQFGEMVSSINLTLVVSTAIVHRKLHQEGNFVHVSLSGSAAFSAYQGSSVMSRTPAFARIANHTDIKSAHLSFPVPLSNCYRTKDGVWVQFLGIELPKHIGRVTKALNLKRMFPKIIKHVIFDLVLGGSAPLFVKATPMFRTMNTFIQSKVAALNMEQLKERLDMYDCWYCYIRDMNEVTNSTHATENGFFEKRIEVVKGKQVESTFVKMPVEYVPLEQEHNVEDSKDQKEQEVESISKTYPRGGPKAE